MTTIAELYQERCQRPERDADIWEHLPTLRLYAEQVRHVTEFGTRSGNSTTGLLMGLARSGGYLLHSYDIDQTTFTAPAIPGVEWRFTRHDIRKLQAIEPTELLFLDDCHDHEHVLWELRTFAKWAEKYIIMHDTSTEWIGGDKVRKARDIFLSETKDWFLANHWNNCNGLSVLERHSHANSF